MDLYLLAELKTVALKITTVDMLKPPPDFRCHLIFASLSTTSPLPVCPTPHLCPGLPAESVYQKIVGIPTISKIRYFSKWGKSASKLC